jgi:hypothetical protein
MKSKIKHTSFITSKSDVDAMVRALSVMPDVDVTRTETGVVVKAGKSGIEVLRAMIGSSGSYLVRHVEGIFLAPEHTEKKA